MNRTKFPRNPNIDRPNMLRHPYQFNHSNGLYPVRWDNVSCIDKVLIVMIVAKPLILITELAQFHLLPPVYTSCPETNT